MEEHHVFTRAKNLVSTISKSMSFNAGWAAGYVAGAGKAAAEKTTAVAKIAMKKTKTAASAAVKQTTALTTTAANTVNAAYKAASKTVGDVFRAVGDRLWAFCEWCWCNCELTAVLFCLSALVMAAASFPGVFLSVGLAMYMAAAAMLVSATAYAAVKIAEVVAVARHSAAMQSAA